MDLGLFDNNFEIEQFFREDSELQNVPSTSPQNMMNEDQVPLFFNNQEVLFGQSEFCEEINVYDNNNKKNDTFNVDNCKQQENNFFQLGELDNFFESNNINDNHQTGSPFSTNSSNSSSNTSSPISNDGETAQLFSTLLSNNVPILEIDNPFNSGDNIVPGIEMKMEIN